ncbi:hypothetical protein K0M31_008296, partial [Melipona bicolor]
LEVSNSTNPKTQPCPPWRLALSRFNCGTSRLRFKSKRSSWREDWITTTRNFSEFDVAQLLVPPLDSLSTIFGSKFLRITSQLLRAVEKGRREERRGERFESRIGSASLENEIFQAESGRTREKMGTELKIESYAGKKPLV